MNSEALTKFVRERLILKEERRGEDRKGRKGGKDQRLGYDVLLKLKC